jgi:LPXTG-motif cell wall-anchored protein
MGPNIAILTAGLVIIAAAAIFFSLKKKREAPKVIENKTK